MSELLSKKQLGDVARCEENICSQCSVNVIGICISDEVQTLVAKTALACMAILEQVEWCKSEAQDDGYFYDTCPVCNNGKNIGHEMNCKLAALLKEADT